MSSSWGRQRAATSSSSGRDEGAVIAGLGATGDKPATVITPARGWRVLDPGELWEYRELLYFLVWRDVKVRYKQTLLGAAWAIVQPASTMVAFTLFFGLLARLPSDGLPYPVFYYSALLPWLYFAGAVSEAT